eukprot:scaffold2201_cov240-Pinguiococcus_pyrenoidosus.AAC.6
MHFLHALVLFSFLERSNVRARMCNSYFHSWNVRTCAPACAAKVAAPDRSKAPPLSPLDIPAVAQGCARRTRQRVLAGAGVGRAENRA